MHAWGYRMGSLTEIYWHILAHLTGIQMWGGVDPPPRKKCYTYGENMKLTSIIRYYERNTDHSLFFLWHHYFCWCKHFCWWRHQKTVKIRQKLRIWYLANHYSYESDLPLVGKLLDNCIQKMGHKPYFVLIFCWRQHFLSRNIQNLFHVMSLTSRDVIMSDFHKNVRKCFSSLH